MYICVVYSHIKKFIVSFHCSSLTHSFFMILQSLYAENPVIGGAGNGQVVPL